MACSVWPCRIANGHAFGRVEILANLAPHEHHCSARHDGLAEIIVQILLRVGVFGVEGSNALVHGHETSLSLI
jgi:hypothetical protein